MAQLKFHSFNWGSGLNPLGHLWSMDSNSSTRNSVSSGPWKVMEKPVIVKRGCMRAILDRQIGHSQSRIEFEIFSSRYRVLPWEWHFYGPVELTIWTLNHWATRLKMTKPWINKWSRQAGPTCPMKWFTLIAKSVSIPFLFLFLSLWRAFFATIKTIIKNKFMFVTLNICSLSGLYIHFAMIYNSRKNKLF